jgi:hypothetical protein
VVIFRGGFILLAAIRIFFQEAFSLAKVKSGLSARGHLYVNDTILYVEEGGKNVVRTSIIDYTY